MTKYLTTLCLIGGGILPILVDVNTSHLLNPDWDSHARVHEAWRLSTNFLVFSLGIFLLWSKNKEMLGGLLSLCIHFGFVLGAAFMPFYGGEPVGEGIPEPEILMLPLNVFFFGSMFLLQSAVLMVVFKKNNLSLSGELR
jgi:hypothetical protein|tara:strand:- start:905 stop:1324 length:420 start_codon:yes stop_codon:yes gene_type:complete